MEKLLPEGIIGGNPGIGKSTFVKENGARLDVVDLDAEPYLGDPSWPENYMEKILSVVNKHRLILISSFPKVVKALMDHGLKITVVCADEGLQEEYRQRYLGRGNDKELAESLVIRSHTSRAEQQKRFAGARVIFLGKGKYLSDIIDLC